MPDFSKLADTVLKLVKANGRELPIIKPSETVDQSTGVVSASDDTEGTIFGIILPRYKGILFDSMDDTLKDGLISGKFRSMLCAAKGATFPPEPNCEITVDGSTWRVVGVTELSPTGTPVIYNMGVIQL